ncbi:MAG: hypothetical protein ACRDS0_14560 [Pseudonocardiaceae bacterium]
MSSTAREVRAGGSDPAGGEAASLVESAMLLRWRAPELALLLADRAVTAAQDDRMAVLRADHLAVFALNRLGRHGEAVHRLFPAIRDADTPQGLRHELHVELAHCAAAIGEPATALDAVHAVLAAGDDVAPALRGGALVAVAEASLALGHDDLVTSTLEEADELYREDRCLDHDTALLLRAAVRAIDAARHRGRGAAAAAEAKSREGRELLAGLADPDHDSGEVSARLMLELARTLLDRGAGEIAMQEVRPLLQRPVRAAAASSVGRLRLALATQVHLAEGRHDPALTLLADAVEGAQRHGVDAVLAECLEGLSHVHEARDEFADALYCMRAARAAEARHRREVAAARSTLLENCGSARRERARLVGQVAELLAGAGTGCAGPDSDTGPLHTEPAQAAEPEISESRVVVVESAEEQRAEVEPAEEQPHPIAPASTPATTGISLVGSTVVSTEPVDLPAVVQPTVDGPTPVQEVESSSGLESWQSRARHRWGGAGALVSVSDLLPASALSAGRPGRRRAEEPEDRADETSPSDSSPTAQGDEARGDETQGDEAGSAPVDDTQAFPATWREYPASGPPPAPTAQALAWEPADENTAQEGENKQQMGLGDLLAEALAAYQESRDVGIDARSNGTSRSNASTAVDVETNRDLPRYRGPDARWTAGLALAPSPTVPDMVDPDTADLDPDGAAEGEPAEAITNPLLRLPDLTAEPRWAPPDAGRRSAAGD